MLPFRSQPHLWTFAFIAGSVGFWGFSLPALRLASNCDVPFLPEIERSSGEIFRQWPGLEWIADDDVQSKEQHRALIGEGVAFVAELQGYGIAAFLNGEMMPDALHIWQMAVHCDQQGRSIGRKLMEAAQQFATDHGSNALTLTTFRKCPGMNPTIKDLDSSRWIVKTLSPG